MHKMTYYRNQRNKYYALSQTAPNSSIRNECLRIMYWYIGQIYESLNKVDILKNSLFIERYKYDCQKDITNSMKRYTDSLEKYVGDLK